MTWFIFAVIVYIALFILVPIKRIKELWIIGVITLILLYLIDSTLIKLGAFSYVGNGPMISDLPVFYWISGFAAGIYLIHFKPKRIKMRLPYILLMAFIFLIIEIIMMKLGYFRHHNWNVINSFVLNTMGFIITAWLATWVEGSIKKKS